MKMELIAALLHSPEVLFLDEPTIGLDVVAQHNIQQFLKYYQEQRRITVLLTSHYLKDVAALCKRVVVIAKGQVQYDGSLTGIVDSFSGAKVITLQLAEGTKPERLERYGEVLSIELPKIKLKCSRTEVSKVLALMLQEFSVQDIAVEDPPLEEVIAAMFSRVSAGDEQVSQQDATA